MEKKTLAILCLVFFMFSFLLQIVSAVDFGSTPSASDRAKFDQILSPVLKIYNLIRYIASAIAVVVLVIAGMNYIVSGSDPGRREKAKSMAMYVLIGLVVIWAAPLIVDFIVD